MANIQEILISSKVGPVGKPVKPANQGQSAGVSSGESFDQALQKAEINISRHAQKRLEARQISLTPSDEAKLNDAIRTLETKGARDSLVLMGELALVVNVPSKTVVTAMEQAQMKEQVFTNIDSTILVSR